MWKLSWWATTASGSTRPANSRRDLVEQARALGGNDFIAKPVERDLLLEKISRML